LNQKRRVTDEGDDGGGAVQSWRPLRRLVDTRRPRRSRLEQHPRNCREWLSSGASRIDESPSIKVIALFQAMPPGSILPRMIRRLRAGAPDSDHQPSARTTRKRTFGLPYPDMDRLRLMAVLAHPDDESLGFGGTLAKYAAEGVETFLVTATRGERGRYRGLSRDDPRHPGPEALATIREAELRAAASALGVHDLLLLDFGDQQVDRANPRDAIAAIAGCIRRVRPDVLVTFGPEGAYGHPDHIAISQFATAAAVAAADPGFAIADAAVPPHAVSKLYYMEWPQATWTAYEEALRKLRWRSTALNVRRCPGPTGRSRR
jgi:LmbE family N-acetylglucosaminyl deacetylase